MAKFNTAGVKPHVSSPIVSERVSSARNHEGGAGHARDPKGELFLLAVTNMVGESTFYETAAGRDDRYAGLVRQVAVDDPEWTARFLGWLRGDANMRSASLVGAAEAARTLIAAKIPGGRQIVDSVLQRADEPGEMLAYWTSTYGRAVPIVVKKGVADAARRLYTERAFLKHDTDSKGFRFADVLELTHPKPVADWQGDLFAHALDRRHGRDGEVPASLPTVAANARLRAAAADNPRVLLDPGGLKAAGMTWEDVLSLAGGRLPKKELWESLIPSLPYMASLRNLKGMDEAGVSDDAAAVVAARLSDPAQVAKSRQLPMRFLSAYRAAPSLRWSYPLEQALGHCLDNIPALPGRTLVLVDTSGSMHMGFSKDGTLMRWDAAVLFGVALAQRCAHADVVSFSNHTGVFPVHAGESLLKALDRWKRGGYFFGHGTATAAAVRAHFAGHDRVVILTDEQAGYDAGTVDQSVPKQTPLVTFNLAGYRHGHAPSGTGSRVTIGGLTDHAFRLIPLLEVGRNADWDAIFGPPKV